VKPLWLQARWLFSIPVLARGKARWIMDNSKIIPMKLGNGNPLKESDEKG
jgi:hypothetical protein